MQPAPKEVEMKESFDLYTVKTGNACGKNHDFGNNTIISDFLIKNVSLIEFRLCCKIIAIAILDHLKRVFSFIPSLFL